MFIGAILILDSGYPLCRTCKGVKRRKWRITYTFTTAHRGKKHDTGAGSGSTTAKAGRGEGESGLLPRPEWHRGGHGDGAVYRAEPVGNRAKAT